MNEAATVKEVVDIDLPNKTYTLQSANVSGRGCSSKGVTQQHTAARVPAPALGATLH